jgi:hypothetical protein
MKAITIDSLNICMFSFVSFSSVAVMLIPRGTPSRWSDFNLSDISFSGENVDDCALRFYSYSFDQLRRLDKQNLHRPLGEQSLLAERENSLSRTSYSEFWHCIKVIFLSDEGLSLFVESLQFSHLIINIWLKVILRLQGKSDDELRSRRHRCSLVSRIPFESIILIDFASILYQFRDKKWTLLYRRTRDGFQSSNFHNKCDSHSNTITIILTTKDFIFDDFAPPALDSSNAWKSDSTRKSTLFSLKNLRTARRGSSCSRILLPRSTAILRAVHILGTAVIFILQMVAMRTRTVTQTLVFHM